MNGGLVKAFVGVITALALGSIVAALNVWRNQATILQRLDSSVTQAEFQEAIAARDTAVSGAFNTLGKDLARVEAKLDLLLDDRKGHK